MRNKSQRKSSIVKALISILEESQVKFLPNSCDCNLFSFENLEVAMLNSYAFNLDNKKSS